MPNTLTNNLPHQETNTDSHYKGLPIMTTPNTPIYSSILEKSYRELAKICARYSRVILVRADLHPASKGGLHYSDIDIKSFRKTITRKLEKAYQSKVAYCWVREQGKNEYNAGAHWHWWIAVKCNPKQRPHTQSSEIQRSIIQTWQEKVRGECQRNNMAGWFYLDRQSFSPEKRVNDQKQIAQGSALDTNDVYINREIIRSRAINKELVMGGVIDECFYSISYLAKMYTKVRTPSTSNKPVFATSNLKTLDPRDGRQEEIEKYLAMIYKHWSHKLAPVPMKPSPHFPEE